MHISEGVLSAPVLATGAGLALIGLGIGVRRLDPAQIPICGVMAAAFFVASLIHVPIGLANAHLLLCGLVGVLLGWRAFPAIFTALALQALLFQYGGITTLGVNTASMGYGAVCAWLIFHSLLKIFPNKLVLAAFCAGASGTAIAACLTAIALGFTNEGFQAAAGALFLAHLPVIIAEGLLTMLTVGFMARMRPEILGIPPGKATMKNPCQFLFILVLALCLFSPAQAAAHRLNVFAWLDNDQILVECNFGDKRPAVNAKVNVTDDATRQALLHGSTNGDGRFAFPVPEVIRQGHGLLITVNAGQGHVGQWTMDASELYAAAALTAGFDAAAIEGRQQEHEHIRLRAAPPQPDAAAQAAPAGNVALPASQMSQEEMRAMLHGALEQHLSPIHRQLAAQAAKGPGMTEIIGGLGWIIGLVGVALYFKSRKA